MRAPTMSLADPRLKKRPLTARVVKGCVPGRTALAVPTGATCRLSVERLVQLSRGTVGRDFQLALTNRSHHDADISLSTRGLTLALS
jgi:hypothetical protein